MNNQANELLANIRELTVELHNGELTTQDKTFLMMIAEVLGQIRADGVPMHPVIEYVREYVSPKIIADWL